MLRHVIAPARFFSQVPNDLVRHPRLSANAVRLLIWQLSLPDGAASQPLSVTGERAGIKNATFTRAKRELAAEGYLHEWRAQGEDGRWATRQLVSNVPLTAEDALRVRDGGQPADSGAPAPATTSPPPTPPNPAAGEPTPRSVGRPHKKKEENTSHPPHPLAERGAQALAAVSHTERRLRLSGRDVARLAPLAAEWLLRGATLTDLREALTHGLPERVHSPAGITRDRLLRKMPDRDTGPATPPVPPPQPLRLCTGGCGRMMRPVSDETRCRDCRLKATGGTASAGAPDGAVAATLRGAAAVRESLRGGRRALGPRPLSGSVTAGY
ncbi:hypothetical protein [Streptomyces eurocidicus]|uniref:DNA-binding protein n=1 Tax=Streptomyces eurocidicus TaxID=66423 RepID=A0A7W8F0V4_STREU|nr:hypothetical protein [Streptomyces eurocidicus]MBB5117080.1 hypothetical protein [Streptomyces eurocidicus]MBF6052624.1 hypothetical protein [Streptomyces eurocidicus]